MDLDEIKKRENEQYFTFQCNVRQMCKDVLAKLEEQESVIAELKHNLELATDECCSISERSTEKESRLRAEIAELEESHKKKVEMLSTYCREQTEKLCIEMTFVDSLEQNLKKLNRTIWLCRAWAARNLALYYKLWCERYKDNSNESLASCYLDDSKKWESFYHKFKALADKFKEEA